MESLPFSLLILIAFLFGSVIGSFGNVVICRLHTGKSLNGNSHCLSCGRTLAWYDMLPVVSYLALRGRCRTCGCWIPARYLLVEVITACSFVLVVLTSSGIIPVLLTAAFVAVLVMAGAYDMYHLIIPDELVWWATAIASVTVGYQAYAAQDPVHFLFSLVAGAIAFGVYGGLWYISGGRWLGFGDAKLALPLGIMVGLAHVFSLIVLSFWVGAVMSVLYIAGVYLRRAYASRDVGKIGRYFTMKHEVPFAPFLIIAFYLAMFFNVDVLALTSYALM